MGWRNRKVKIIKYFLNLINHLIYYFFIYSLAATIKFERPDLLNDLNFYSPISLNPPQGYFPG